MPMCSLAQSLANILAEVAAQVPALQLAIGPFYVLPSPSPLQPQSPVFACPSGPPASVRSSDPPAPVHLSGPPASARLSAA